MNDRDTIRREFADELIDECQSRHNDCLQAGNKDAAQWWRSFAAFVHVQAGGEDPSAPHQKDDHDLDGIEVPLRWKFWNQR